MQKMKMIKMSIFYTFFVAETVNKKRIMERLGIKNIKHLAVISHKN